MSGPLLTLQVNIAADQPRSMMLHWAVNDWNLAPQSAWPQGTQQIDDKAVQTPFEGGQRVELTFPEEQCPSRSWHWGPVLVCYGQQH